MPQEEKQLLLADLCARSPYYPIVSVAYNYSDKGIIWEHDILRIKLLLEIEENDSWEYVKPYLRPMSSMTEEEKEELIKNFWGSHTAKDTFEELSWYLSKHFDINELIPRGLAVAVTEDNNPYKE